MKRFIVLLIMALPLFFGAAAAHADTAPKRVIHHWEPFDIGNQNPKELADKIRASLKIDATGNLIVDTKNCKPSNSYSCATPKQYLEGLQKSDERANIHTFGDLLVVLDRLQMTDPPKGEYWMACIQKQPDGTTIVLWNCMTREFDRLPDGAAESAWVDPETGKVVLAQHCTNPVGAKVDDCDEQHIWIHGRKIDHGLRPEAHGVFIGPEAIPDDVCRPAIKKVGAKEWSNAILDECHRCDYSAIVSHLKEERPEIDWKVQNFQISFEAEEDGEYVIRVPRFVEHTKGQFDYCLLFPDGTQTEATVLESTAYHSFGWAYIDYTGSEAMSAKARAEKGWNGKVVHSWVYTGARAFIGPRPPIAKTPAKK